MVEGGGSCGGGSRRRVVRESGSPVRKALGDAEPEKERGFNPVRKKWVPRENNVL